MLSQCSVREDNAAIFLNLLDFAIRTHDTGDDAVTVKDGIGAFGMAIISAIDALKAMDKDPFKGIKPFEPGASRPSDLFAVQGQLSKAIWFLCARMPQREYQKFRQDWAGKAELLKKATDRLIMRLHGDVESLYPAHLLIRPFAQLRFLLRLHHEWLWEPDAEEPPILKAVAQLSSLSLDECHRQMRGHEKLLERAYADGTISDYIKERRKSPLANMPKDRASITEDLLLSVKYKDTPRIRCLELSLVLLQYACCMIGDYLKEGQSFYARLQTAMPSQRMSDLFDSSSIIRRSLSFVTSSYCQATDLIRASPEQASAAYGAFLGLLERFEMLNLVPNVTSTLRQVELAANDYFRGVVSRRPHFFFCDKTEVFFQELSTSLDGFVTALRTFEYEQSTGGGADVSASGDSAKLDQIMRLNLLEIEMMSTLQTGQNSGNRKLDTVIKDVKVIKAEQNSPSEADSTKHGPVPKHPAMIDAAISLLKEWAAKNPAPNTASAAHNIFVKWEKDEKSGELKPGNRYTNEKSFKGIVARHWARVRLPNAR